MARCLGNSMIADQSLVVHDPTAAELRALVSVTKRSLVPDDLLIVYFSGHGEDDGAQANLLLADASPADLGRLSTAELGAAVRATTAVFILDCCSAGGALGLANQTDPFLRPRVSVLASARQSGTAAHTPMGSPFTVALCGALDQASETGESVSVLSLTRALESEHEYTGECLVNLAEGQSDVLLVPRQERLFAPIDFPERFLRRLRASGSPEREMLWYGLAAMAEHVRVDTLRAWIDDPQRADASWLVRRATGSVISGLPPRSPSRNLFSSGLLSATNWMDRTVGVISVRRDLDRDPDSAQCLREILTSSAPMDLVWLAHLYLSDHGPQELGASLASPLPETEWGAIEIWHRFCSAEDSEAHARALLIVDEVNRRSDGDQGLRALATHAALEGHPIAALRGLEDTDLVGNPLAMHLHALRPRGGVQQPAGKWLTSTLYGNWRDQVTADVQRWLRDYPEEDARSLLEAMSRLPSVSLRRAIIEDFVGRGDPRGIANDLGWGLVDPHPWVRRAALELFGPSAFATVFADRIDRRRFPGMSDLVVCGAGLGFAGWADFVSLHGVAPVEMDAIARDCTRQGR
jgi:hypothetical protein